MTQRSGNLVAVTALLTAESDHVSFNVFMYTEILCLTS